MRRRLTDFLGGPMCVNCGESDEVVLTIDHVNGGGTAARKKHGGYLYMLHCYLTNPEEARGKATDFVSKLQLEEASYTSGQKGPLGQT
jgi:hypothetical protein